MSGQKGLLHWLSNNDPDRVNCKQISFSRGCERGRIGIGKEREERSERSIRGEEKSGRGLTFNAEKKGG